MSTDKIQTGLRLPESTYNKLRWICKMEERTMNGMVTYLVTKFIREFERQHGPVPDTPEE